MSKVIAFKKCGYFNALKFLFQNTVSKSTCKGAQNTAEAFTAALLC